MNIFIYGSAAYKKQIHEVLNHGNMKFKIGDGEIIDVNYLDDIKSLIKEDATHIFLIDQSKVIYDDFMGKYLKFLVPKDGIHKKFLDKYGMGDISLRDPSDLMIYIDKRLEAMEKTRPKAQDITSIDEMMEVFNTEEDLDKPQSPKEK